MKKHIIYKSLILIVVLAVSGCQDKLYEKFMANSPIYMSYEDLRSAVKKETARDIEKPGKIYFKDNYLFINELMEGVHVLDVSDPANPNHVGFIEIPGNVDIAIKENVLYADSYVDLVAIDVSDLDNIQEVGRIEDIFPYTVPEYDEEYRLAELDEDKGVVVDWEVKKVEQEVEQYYYPVYYARSFAENIAMDAASFTTNTSGVGGGSGTTFGVGGSMARFGLYKDYLYTVDDYNLYTFDISDIESPLDLDSKNIGWNVETMFIYNDHLFFGTTSGMLIYSLEIERNPTFVNQYNHITSCDPVVVQDDIAYVTLHDGGWCGRSVNRLDVIKMKDNYTELDLLASHSMANPHGLGIDGDILFICDGDAGLKVFNAADPLTISSNKIAEFPDINAYDVIPVADYLFMIGEGGFYLYDYSDLQNINLLSTIPVSTVED
ncbi:LVIVD repeat-containing protein [Sunxiuqinia sp. A32]|uniref:LVIVD repeat-containing protein n=1 Tax=Sunxiuqinia sp. A32 TaxID=3461496 RepID=UPI00404523A6